MEAAGPYFADQKKNFQRQFILFMSVSFSLVVLCRKLLTVFKTKAKYHMCKIIFGQRGNLDKSIFESRMLHMLGLCVFVL